MLPVLFKDEHYIAVHKPSGLLVHRSWLSQDRVFLLQQLRNQIGQRVYPVHRLDRATSGVIIFGLSSESAQALNQVFTDQRASKSYHAIVRGWLPEPEVFVDHPIQDRETDTPYQEAQTRFRELARTELPFAVDRYPQARYSLVEAQPLTGRRHQIRKHLKHISHPIIGDIRYGKGTHNRFFRQQFGIQRLLLSAQRLRFQHPLTGEAINIGAAEDAEWSRVIQETGLGYLSRLPSV
ncbi:MAG: pseudouridine synthase [Gammaproteobacteria bacterium]|nr:pseudouridine synthase [Gammaproteobacteria bacterium]